MPTCRMNHLDADEFPNTSRKVFLFHKSSPTSGTTSSEDVTGRGVPSRMIAILPFRFPSPAPGRPSAGDLLTRGVLLFPKCQQAGKGVVAVVHVRRVAGRFQFPQTIQQPHGLLPRCSELAAV